MYRRRGINVLRSLAMLAAVEQVVETFAEWKARLRFSFQAKTWSAFPVSGSKHERNVHFVIAFKGRIIVLYCVPLGEKKTTSVLYFQRMSKKKVLKNVIMRNTQVMIYQLHNSAD